MSNRHLSRSIVLQSLYEWDFNDRKCNLSDCISYNSSEFAPGMEKDDFIQSLYKGVVRNIKKIDKIIKIYATEWPISQISIVDRNILRIGIYEILFDIKTHPKIIINESIELAKNFSGINSSKFINGVIGGLYENLKDKIINKNFIYFIVKYKNNYIDFSDIFLKKEIDYKKSDEVDNKEYIKNISEDLLKKDFKDNISKIEYFHDFFYTKNNIKEIKEGLPDIIKFNCYIVICELKNKDNNYKYINKESFINKQEFNNVKKILKEKL
ncbi:transcription antitermination factor NusB [Patescibacteria group bacterium]|nr:transcription antitermination factor NusB [Patescibacteria group bacterium]